MNKKTSSKIKTLFKNRDRFYIFKTDKVYVDMNYVLTDGCIVFRLCEEDYIDLYNTDSNMFPLLNDNDGVKIEKRNGNLEHICVENYNKSLDDMVNIMSDKTCTSRCRATNILLDIGGGLVRFFKGTLEGNAVETAINDYYLDFARLLNVYNNPIFTEKCGNSGYCVSFNTPKRGVSILPVKCTTLKDLYENA